MAVNGCKSFDDRIGPVVRDFQPETAPNDQLVACSAQQLFVQDESASNLVAMSKVIAGVAASGVLTSRLPPLESAGPDFQETVICDKPDRVNDAIEERSDPVWEPPVSQQGSAAARFAAHSVTIGAFQQMDKASGPVQTLKRSASGDDTQHSNGEMEEGSSFESARKRRKVTFGPDASPRTAFTSLFESNWAPTPGPAVVYGRDLLEVDREPLTV